MNSARDPVWTELEALARRAHARLEDQFGRCPVCRQPATAARVVLSITWAVCAPCGVRWCVGPDVLADPIGDTSDDVRQVMQELARFVGVA